MKQPCKIRLKVISASVLYPWWHLDVFLVCPYFFYLVKYFKQNQYLFIHPIKLTALDGE